MVPDVVSTAESRKVSSPLVAAALASGTIAVKAIFPNADLALWPGQYVDVELEAGKLPAAVTVPTIAVQKGQKGTFAYVVKEDATVEMRPVTVALVDGGRSALASGLNAGEKVVTEGQLRLRNGAQLRKADGAQDKPSVEPPASGQRRKGKAALAAGERS
jgi:membrane fusion protein, multidrug efflux system